MVTVALLMAGTAAAIVVAQHLRDEAPVASSIFWKTRPGPRYRVCFLLGRDDRVRVSVVDFSNRLIRVLADQELAGGDDAHLRVVIASDQLHQATLRLG